MNRKKRRGKRLIVCLLMAAVTLQTLWADGVAADAKEGQKVETGTRESSGREQSIQKKKRTERLSLSKEEKENEEEGWSWKKDEDDPLSYTLTLEHVNFEVANHSAIDLYASDGFPIRFINIVLIGENRIVSTHETDNYYNGCGIYMNANDAAVKPAVAMNGGGSLTVKGYRCGLSFPGCMNVEDVTLDAQSERGSDALIVKETLSARNGTLRSNYISANLLTATDCDIQVSTEKSFTQATSLVNVGSCDMDGCTLKLAGPEGAESGYAYAALISHSQDELKIRNSSLDICNVEWGIYIQTGTICLENITGSLFCSNTDIYLNGKNPALFANKVNVSDSDFYAQTGNHVFAWGDASLPEEIKELTITGNLTIEDGKTFTIGEDQSVTFTNNPAYIKGGEETVLINHGTLKFTSSTNPQVKTKLVNHGTLYTKEGIDCKDVRTQFTNTGEFNGAVTEKNGETQYIYGMVTLGRNLFLGDRGWGVNKRFLTPGAVLTIPDGVKLDAANDGNMTWDELDEYLSLGEGSRIVVEAGGTLLLPADDTNHQVDNLNLSGDGTVQIGDSVLYKVTYMEGESIWKSSFANGDNRVSEPVAPVKDGYNFMGWFTGSEGGEKFDFSHTVPDDLVLYARWELRPVGVKPKGDSIVSVKDGAFLTYGQKLSELAFAPVVFVEEGTDTEVAGRLSWKTPSDIPEAGTGSAEWVFVPDDTGRYLEQTGSAAITVVKATPEAGTPTVGTITYHPSMSLESRELEIAEDAAGVEGTWTWKDGSIVPAVKNDGYAAVFTPKDVTNYNTVERVVPVDVKSATPYISVLPSAAQITVGQCLGDSVLSGGSVQYSESDTSAVPGSFSWKRALEKPDVPESGEAEYAVVFTPSDGDNYESVEATVKIRIVRAACEHKNTRIVNARAATEQTEGYTGDIVCENCGEKIENGKSIPILENKNPMNNQPLQTPVPSEASATKDPAKGEVPSSGTEPNQSISKSVRRKNAFRLNAKLKARQIKRKIRVKWGKVPGADGYDIYVQYCGNRYGTKIVRTIKKGSKTKTTIRKMNQKALNRKRNFKIYVVAYKMADGSKITLGKSMALHIAGKKSKKYTNVKRIKVKKHSYVLKRGSTARIQANAVRYNKNKKLFSARHVKTFRFISSDRNVARVTAAGKIVAKKAGSSTIYVCAGNGCRKKIKVIVK